jgi:hypothetical protein
MTQENNKNSLYIEKVNHDNPLDHLSDEDIQETYTVYVRVKSVEGERQYILKDRKSLSIGNHPDDDIDLTNDSSFASHVTLELKNNQFILASLPSKTQIISQEENSLKLFVGFNEVFLTLNKPKEIAEKKPLDDIKPEVYQLLTKEIKPKKYFWEKMKTLALVVMFFLPNIFFYFMNTDHEISDLDSIYNSSSTSVDFFLIFLFYLGTFINYKKHNIFGISYKYWKFKIFNKFIFYTIILSLASYYLSSRFADQTSFIYNLGFFFLSFMLMENWFQISIFNKKIRFSLRIISFLLLLGWFMIKMSMGLGGYISL